MSLLTIKYPLDLTGKNPNNLVVGEVHNLKAGTNRTIVPIYGAFYTKDLVIRTTTQSTPLVPHIHYVPTHLHEEATLASGLEVCQLIVITDTTIIGDITIDYHCVGGDYSVSVDALEQLIQTLNLDQRPVVWGEVLAKPTAFPPSDHLHDAGDLYGFEYVVQALESLRRAILLGDVQSHQEIYDYIDQMVQGYQEQIDALNVGLEAHKQDVNNPHATTKAQVGLGNVSNFLLATKLEAEQGISNIVYMSALRVREAITAAVGTLLDNHLADVNNPHNTTKAQVGLGNVADLALAVKVEAEQGTINTAYMTPLRVKEAITFQVGTSLSTHIQDKNNPHTTTAAQVGAYTKAEADTLLAGKLGVNATAVNSSKLENNTLTQVLAAAYAQVGSMGKRELWISTADPVDTQGAIGDVWFKY